MFRNTRRMFGEREEEKKPRFLFRLCLFCIRNERFGDNNGAPVDNGEGRLFVRPSHNAHNDRPEEDDAAVGDTDIRLYRPVDLSHFVGIRSFSVPNTLSETYRHYRHPWRDRRFAGDPISKYEFTISVNVTRKNRTVLSVRRRRDNAENTESGWPDRPSIGRVLLRRRRRTQRFRFV